MTIFYNSTINLSTDISINDLSGFTVDGDIGNVNRSLYFNISDINGWIGDGIGSTPQFGISNVGVEISKFTDNLNYGISDDTAHIDVSCIAVKFSYSLPPEFATQDIRPSSSLKFKLFICKVPVSLVPVKIISLPAGMHNSNVIFL